MADPGLAVLRSLVRQFRGPMIVGCLPFSTRLMMTLGLADFERLLEKFWRGSAPRPFVAAEAEAFAKFVTHKEGTIEGLKQLLAFELATAEVKRTGKARRVRFELDPCPMLEALAEFRRPAPSERGPSWSC